MWRNSALAEFLAWWGGQLGDLLLHQWRNSATAPRNGLAVALESHPTGLPAAVVLSLRRKGRPSSIGRFALVEAGIRAAKRALSQYGRIEPVVLQLPAAMLLDREVALPAAAERDLPQVLAYEMDRLTPFAVNEVFWGWAIAAGDRAHGRLHVDLWLVPKALLMPVFGALARIGIAPTVLEGRSQAGYNRIIVLGRPPSRTARWRRQVLVAGWSGCGALAMAMVAVPFVRQSLAIDEIEASIAALRPKVAEADQLRRRIAAAEAAIDVLAAERLRVGDTLQALAAVTDALADDTYLTEFALRERKLTLNGQSAAAPKLIAALSADPTIRNPAFSAPVTRTENGRAELFSIHADLTP